MATDVTLRPYQFEDLAFHIANPKSLNLSDPGTGKTPTACVLFYYWWREHQAQTVWVMPKSLLGKNRDELLRFTDFAPEDVVILEDAYLSAKPYEQRGLAQGKTYKRLQGYERFFDRLAAGEDINVIKETKAKVILCGFRFFTRFYRELLEAHPRISAIGVDELHMAYGSNDSQNTKALYQAMRKCQFFLGMTGTLLNGRLDSCFPAIHVIEPRYYGSFRGFMEQHSAWEDDYGRTLMWVNTEKVGHILLRHAKRHTFEEVYGKEDVVFLPDMVHMNPIMRENYDLFHEQAMLELEDGSFLDGSLPGVATIRARQIMAHPETLGLCKGEETGKDERLRIHVTDAIERKEQLLIFSAHVLEQVRIMELLQSMGRNPALMNGDTPSSQRVRIDKEFRAGTITDVVGSHECMAVGWNWEHVDHVIDVSRDYGDVDFLQAYRRASRGTRTKTLRVSIMQYAKSVEQRILQLIKEKSILANRVDPTRPILELAA